MDPISRYIDYIQDNPNHYWFRRKVFGWGWTPATIEGWIVVVVFVGALLWTGFSMAQGPEPTEEEILWFLAKVASYVIILIAICYATGEKPRWQWGLPDTSHKKEER